MTMLLYRFNQLAADERGGTAIEYSLIAGLIVIALLSALSSVAGANSNTYQMLERELIVD